MKPISLTRFLLEEQCDMGLITLDLRLLYEANPMAFIVKQAGGAVADGNQCRMCAQPSGLHLRVPILLGASDEAERVSRYHLQLECAA